MGLFKRKVDNYRLNSYSVKVTTEEQDGEPVDIQHVISESSFAPPTFDDITVTYVAAGNGVGQMETVTYWLDGVSQMVITITYGADNKLSGISKST